MCVPRPARSLANLPRAASRLRPHAGVDASSSVPPAPILGQSGPGFGRRDLDPLDRRRGRDAADHAAFRGSPALAPRLRAPRIPTRRQPRASRGAPLARNISPPPEPRSTVPSPVASFLPRSPSRLPPLRQVRRRRPGRSQARPRGGVQAQVRQVRRRVRRVRRPRGEGHHRRGALHGSVLRHVGVHRQVRGAQPLQEHQVSAEEPDGNTVL